MTGIRSFALFVLNCWQNILSYLVGGTYQSQESHTLAMIGLAGWAIYLLCAFVLVKFMCLDSEGYVNKNGQIPFALVIAFLVMIAYFAIIYLNAYQ